MGINSLNKFLRKNCPDVYEEIHISEYAYKKVAIDASIYVCKFKAMYQDKWLFAFIKLVSCLRKNEIHCVFIYDTGCVQEKLAERAERANQRAKLEEKVFKLDEALNHYHKTSEILPVIKELHEKRVQVPMKRLLQKTNSSGIDMRVIEDIIDKMKGQILNISPQDFEKTKQLFDILNVPYFQAPLEAETMCSDLCRRGLVDAALSEDTDVLAYGCPIFLSKINLKTETCVRIKYPHVLEQLQIEDDQFLDLCIMCGTDYNKNIFRVGPEKAYKYIQQFNNIEGIKNNTKLDITILNHERGRELFRKYEQKQIKVKYCGIPDFTELMLFVRKHNIYISVEVLKKSFVPNNIVFENEIVKKEEVEVFEEEVKEEVEEKDVEEEVEEKDVEFEEEVEVEEEDVEFEEEVEED
jgi:5'-3' exonuclease